MVGLDVRRVVVALDLEGDRPALADVNDASILTDADEQLVSLRLLLAELAQMHLARLVRAVLAPHHRVHRELTAGRTTLQDVANPLVLIGFQAQLGIRLLAVGSLLSLRNSVDAHAFTTAARVARDHAPLSLKLIESPLISDEAAFAILQWHHDLLALGVAAGPSRGGILDDQGLITADEVQVVIAGQRARQQMRLAQHLEAVADAKYW